MLILDYKYVNKYTGKWSTNQFIIANISVHNSPLKEKMS